MDVLLLIVAGALTLGAVFITVAACLEMAKTHQALRATRLALAVAEHQAADEEARKETALRLLDEQRTQRLIEYAEYAARLQALEIQYADVLRSRVVSGEKLIPFKGRTH